jgi:SOS-response transcriptional repressor LexA
MGGLRASRRIMARTADEKREILRRFIKERELKVARWAKASGVNANSIYNFLNSHSDGLDLRTYAKLARVAGVPVWKLSGDEPEAPSPTSLWVVGNVEAGAFREAVEWDRSLWYAVDVPVPERFRKVAKALAVRGPSMNLEYPEGSIVIWVDVLDARPPAHEDHVIVYAHANDGTVEATIKEFRIVDNRRWLWPRSSDPSHQTPIDLESPGDGIDRVEIKGLVLGGYKPRII